MPENIFDTLEAGLVRNDGIAPWAARSPYRPDPGCDLKLVPRAQDWEHDDAALAVLDAIERQPWVGAVTRTPRGVDVRLDDGWVHTAGSALEAGGTAEASLTDLADGQRYSVQFWDANATKALHVGHLRNLATGNALAAALAQAGGRVERRSLISDTGRSMGEAMAGVLKSGRVADGDVKSDHFVGACYASYVADSLAANGGGEFPDDTQTRELTVHDDTAEELLRRVLAGDREMIELWFKTRAWVIAGQRKTLSRLDIAFDRVFFESDFFSEAAELLADGLRDGHLKRREDGVVVYPTGIDGFEELPLVRPDGMSTQHMRALVYWSAAPDLDHVTSMQIAGSEWQAGTVCRRRLQAAMQPGGDGRVHPTYDIYNAMVASQKRAITSSEGALLIDDLIEWIDERIGADARWRDVRSRHPSPERVAPQVALGYFLPYPSTRPLDFDAEQLLRDTDSLGWDLARARAHRSGATTAGGPPVEDPNYRFAVVQSELYRRHLRSAVDKLDVSPLALYLKHLAQWHLEADRGEHVERIVHTVLDRSARGLGLEAA